MPEMSPNNPPPRLRATPLNRSPANSAAALTQPSGQLPRTSAAITYKPSERDLLGDGLPKWKEAGFQWISLSVISPDPRNVRKTFPKDEIAALSESLLSEGMRDPLHVRPDPKDPSRCILIGGERRFRASTLAKLTRVPCILVKVAPDATEYEILMAIMADNLHRADPLPIEQAQGYRDMMKAKGTENVSEIARDLKVDPQLVILSLNLLTLPEEIWPHVNSGGINISAARLLVRLKPKVGDERIKALTALLLARSISTTDLERELGAKSGKASTERTPKLTATGSGGNIFATNESLVVSGGTQVTVKSSRVLTPAQIAEALEEAAKSLRARIG